MDELSKLKIDLGPMWTEIELDVFLKGLRQYGLNGVQKMQDTLRQLGYFRSRENLLSVYKKNKNVLESNQNCTPHDLYLILRDHYEQNEPLKYVIIKIILGNETTKKYKKMLEMFVFIYFLERKSIASKFIDISSEIIFSQAQCIDNQAILQQNQLGNNFCKWLMHEYFYSHLDYTYFSLKELQQMIDKANLDWEIVTIKDWRLIKMAIGKPRRFSQIFIQQEQEKLNKFRSVIRNYLFDQNYPIQREIKNLELIHNIVKLAPFTVGQTVLAIHPICKHIHVGVILSTNLPTIVVRFQQPELGVHKIVDQNIQLEERFLSQQQSDDRFDMQQQLSYNYQSETKNSYLSSLVQDVDHFAAAFLVRILQRKYALVGQLKSLNKQAIEKPELLEDDLIKNLYNWTLLQIQYFDQAQKNVLTKFRFRGLNGYQMNSVNNNINKVLQVPLTYMERELEHNDDRNNSKIIGCTRYSKPYQDKIQQQIITATQMFNQQEKDNKLFPLIQSILGVIYTININGDTGVNHHLKSLNTYIENQNPEQFREINDQIQRIIRHQNK